MKENRDLFIAGIVFGFGLAVGGMSKPETVISFLALEDYGLFVLLFSATGVNFFAINVVPNIIKTPILGGEFKPRKRKFGLHTLTGAIIFGVGWGLSGQCPGSAISSLGMGNLPVLAGIAGMFIGAYVMGRWFS